MTNDKKLKKMNSVRVDSYRDRQLLVGRERKDYYLTPKEHELLREYLKGLRKE